MSGNRGGRHNYTHWRCAISITYTCRDCVDETPDVVTFTHSETCPHSALFEAVCDADREWFAAHPAEVEYWRPVTWPEVQDLRAAGILPIDLPGALMSFVGNVHVYLIEPPNIGARARRFVDVALIVGPK